MMIIVIWWFLIAGLDYQRLGQIMDRIDKKMSECWRVYRYMMVVDIVLRKGSQGVGKTNLITRFTKDEFIDNHNLILEGEQTTIFHLNRTKYQLIFDDHHNVTSLNKLPLEFYHSIQGIVFVFSFEKEETFEIIEQELRYLEEQILPILKKPHLSRILVGNKKDKMAPSLEIEDCKGQIKLSNRTSLQQRARLLSQEKKLKYFQISSKCSPRKEIQKLYTQLINQNDIDAFKVPKVSKSGWSALSLPLPCASEENYCVIY